MKPIIKDSRTFYKTGFMTLIKKTYLIIFNQSFFTFYSKEART
jgi:hypothetical protein